MIFENKSDVRVFLALGATDMRKSINGLPIPVLDLLHREIRSGPLINLDETTVQVLAEPGRKSTT